jgi:hypothetical protein
MGAVSAKLRKTEHGFMHWCPGCEKLHHVNVGSHHEGRRPNWTFDGNLDAPTFSPSVLHRWGKFVDPKFVEESPDESGLCHYFIRSGRIEFCGDCTHGLKGATVELPDLPRHLLD